MRQYGFYPPPPFFFSITMLTLPLRILMCDFNIAILMADLFIIVQPVVCF